MKKRTTVKELEQKELEDLDRLEDLIVEHENSIPILDRLEDALKQPIFFRIPTGIDREALHTYLQVQYKQHIDNMVMPLVKQLGDKIDE